MSLDSQEDPVHSSLPNSNGEEESQQQSFEGPTESNGKEEEEEELNGKEEISEEDLKFESEERSEELEEEVETEEEGAIPAAPPPGTLLLNRYNGGVMQMIQQAANARRQVAIDRPVVSTTDLNSEMLNRFREMQNKEGNFQEEVERMVRKLGELPTFKNFAEFKQIFEKVEKISDKLVKFSDQAITDMRWPVGTVVTLRQVAELVNSIEVTLKRTKVLLSELRNSQRSEFNSFGNHSNNNNVQPPKPVQRRDSASKITSTVRVGGNAVSSQSNSNALANSTIQRLQIAITDNLVLYQTSLGNVQRLLKFLNSGFSEEFLKKLLEEGKREMLQMFLMIGPLIVQKAERIGTTQGKSVNSSFLPKEVCALMIFLYNANKNFASTICTPAEMAIASKGLEASKEEGEEGEEGEIDPVFLKWLDIYFQLEEIYFGIIEKFPELANGTPIQLRSRLRKETLKTSEKNQLSMKLEPILASGTVQQLQEFVESNGNGNDEEFQTNLLPSNGYSWLAFAISEGNLEISKFLILQNPKNCLWNEDKSSRNKFGAILFNQNNLFHLFFSRNSFKNDKEEEILGLLLENGTNPNHSNVFGSTPLHIALENQQAVSFAVSFIRMAKEKNVELDLYKKDSHQNSCFQNLMRRTPRVNPPPLNQNKFFGTGSFASYFNNPSLSDVTFVVNAVSFPAHRIVLCSQSKVFKSMLEEGWREGGQKQVEIKDIHPSGFRCLLEYCYTGNYTIPKEDILLDILIAADRFDFESLRVSIENSLSQKIALQNAFMIMSAATLQDCRLLKDCAARFILEHYSELEEYDKEQEEAGVKDFEFLFLSIQALKDQYEQKKM